MPSALPGRTDEPDRRGESGPFAGRPEPDRSGESSAPVDRREPIASPPRPAPGRAIRLRGVDAPVRFLWPTDERTSYPYVGVVTGAGGHRFPVYLETERVERFCRDAVVVDADTIPVEAPPHAALGE